MVRGGLVSVLPIVLLVASGSAPLLPGAEAADVVPCLPHPPIEITEYEGMDGLIIGHDPLSGDPIYRPGSGVVAGDGTEGDPFRIEGWCITAADIAIRIVGTSAHVVVADNRLEAHVYDHRLEPLVGELPEAGLLVEGARNLTIAGNTIEGPFATGIHYTGGDRASLIENSVAEARLVGIHVAATPLVDLDGNWMRESGNGIRIDGSSVTTLRANVVVFGVGDGIHITSASGVVLEENRILANGGTGIRLQDAPGSAVRHNAVSLNLAEGIFMERAADSVMAANAVAENGGEAILLVDSDRPEVRGNELRANGGAGLVFYGSDAAQVDGNTALGNLGGGIVLDDAHDHQITQNILDGNGLYGIDLDDTQRTVVEANEVTDSGRAGIWMQEASDTLVRGNIASRNGWAGITPSGTRNTFDGNEVHDNDREGFFIHTTTDSVFVDNNVSGGVRGFSASWSTSRNTYTGNDVTGSLWEGFSLSGSSGNHIEGNRFADNGRHGLTTSNVESYHPTGNVIVDNTFTRNGMWGMSLQAAHDSLVQNNTITENGDTGVRITRTTNLTVANNHIADNDGRGILIQTLGQHTIIGNRIADHWYSGIQLEDTDQNRIIGNTITGSGDIGVRLLDAHDNVLEGNDVEASDGHDLHVDRSTGLRLRNNTLERGLQLAGDLLAHHTLDDDGSNTVAGLPLAYIQGANGLTAPTGVGQLILVNVTDVLVDGLHVNDSALGLKVAFSEQVTIRDSSFHGNDIGIDTYVSPYVHLERVTVKNSTGHGIHMELGRGSITQSESSGNGGDGIRLANHQMGTLSDNTVTDNDGTGITIHCPGAYCSANWVTARDNLVARNGEDGIYLQRGFNLQAHHNIVTDNGENGIQAYDSDKPKIRWNTISGNGEAGVLVTARSWTATREATVAKNVITDNPLGIKVGHARDTTISANNIHGNTVGLQAEAKADVTATGNWWGDGSGPSGGAADGCTGTFANGDGDPLVIKGDATVCFDAWLAGPVADAGA